MHLYLLSPYLPWEPGQAVNQEEVRTSTVLVIAVVRHQVLQVFTPLHTLPTQA